MRHWVTSLLRRLLGRPSPAEAPPIGKIHPFIKTRRYGPLRGPTSSSCGGLQPSAEALFALWAKKELIILFWPIFGNFWCPVVTLVTFSSNLRNFERNPKKPIKIQQKNRKISKKIKNPKKVQKCK